MYSIILFVKGKDNEAHDCNYQIVILVQGTIFTPTHGHQVNYKPTVSKKYYRVSSSIALCYFNITKLKYEILTPHEFINLDNIPLIVHEVDIYDTHCHCDLFQVRFEDQQVWPFK